jgi:hypothetical protein
MELHYLLVYAVELEAFLNQTRKGSQNGHSVVEGVRTPKQSFLAYGLLFCWLPLGPLTT